MEGEGAYFHYKVLVRQKIEAFVFLYFKSFFSNICYLVTFDIIKKIKCDALFVTNQIRFLKKDIVLRMIIYVYIIYLFCMTSLFEKFHRITSGIFIKSSKFSVKNLCVLINGDI